MYIGRDQLIPLYVKYTFSVLMACCFRGENSQEIISLFVEIVHNHIATHHTHKLKLSSIETCL